MNKAFLFALLIALLAASASAIDLGTCGGYIKYSNGSMVTGATVVVQVDGCVGFPNCQKTVTSQSNGYYVAANLKIDLAGTGVTVTANQSNFQGSNTGTANAQYAAFINVTVCSAPFLPTLTHVLNSHVPSVTMSWLSGIDPNLNPTYDQFQLDSNPVLNNSFSPQTASGLSYTAHSWQVRTCNSGCCSNWDADAFSITNSPPSIPPLTIQGDTSNNTVNLQWVSGIDPDGDATHDEYQLDANPVVNPATSPRLEGPLAFGAHTWRVRTCDNTTAANSCSAWNSSSFSVINNPPSVPQLVIQGNTHFTTVAFNWTSGIDPDPGHITHDEFQLDGNPINTSATTLHIESGLSFAAHTWRARTCDNFGACSAWNTSSFNVGNLPPSAAQIVPIPDGNYSNVTLTWTSGIDPEGDPTYDQLDFHNAFDPANVTNETSPATRSNTTGAFLWQVRTCDSYGYCSAWNTTHFLSASCPACPACPAGGNNIFGGGGVWYMCAATALSIMTIMPSIILDGTDFTIPITIRNPDLDMPMSKVHIDFNTSLTAFGGKDQVIIDSAYLDWLGPGQETTLLVHGHAALAEKTEAGLLQRDFQISLVVTEGVERNKKEIYRQQFNVTVATLGTLAILPPTGVLPQECLNLQQALDQCRQDGAGCRQSLESCNAALANQTGTGAKLPIMTSEQASVSLIVIIMILVGMVVSSIIARGFGKSG